MTTEAPESTGAPANSLLPNGPTKHMARPGFDKRDSVPPGTERDPFGHFCLHSCFSFLQATALRIERLVNLRDAAK